MDENTSVRVVIPGKGGGGGGLSANDGVSPLDKATVALGAARVAQARRASSAAAAFLKEWMEAPEKERGPGREVMGKRVSERTVQRLTRRADVVIAENYSVMELARLCATRSLGLEGYFDSLIAIRDDPQVPAADRMRANREILESSYRIRLFERNLTGGGVRAGSREKAGGEAGKGVSVAGGPDLRPGTGDISDVVSGLREELLADAAPGEGSEGASAPDRAGEGGDAHADGAQ